MTVEAKAVKLISECEHNLTQNEYNLRKFKGVVCSCSDVKTIKLYASTIAREGRYDMFLMPPRGAVADVLSKCGLICGGR